MAFDKKRLDTFKWLERVSALSLPGLKSGKLLEFPVLMEMQPHPNNDRYFEGLFFEPNGKDNDKRPWELRLNPGLVIEALKGFKINHIAPSMVSDSTRIQFTGHNNDVSIKVMVMGMR